MHRADTDRIDQTRPPLTVFVMVAASPSIFFRSMISTYFDFSLSICINQVCAATQVPNMVNLGLGFQLQAEACFTSVDRMTEYAVDVRSKGKYT